MNAKPAPPQFSLRGMFRLTTWVAALAALVALLPASVQIDLVRMLGMLLVSFAIVAIEWIVCYSIFCTFHWLWRHSGRFARHLTSDAGLRN
jgi:hypothetical protein